MERSLGWIAPHTMLLVGLAFLILGSIFSTLGTVRSMLSRAEENKRIQEQTRRLSEQTSKLRALNERIDLKNDEIKEQTSRLESLNHQIAIQTQDLKLASERLQSSSNRMQHVADETFRKFTGGLSFAILRPSTELLKANALALKLMHRGDYALYDMYLVIRDEDASAAMSSLAAEDYSAFSQTVERHEIHDIIRPGFEESVRFAPPLPDGADKQFFIRMFARNGMVLERLRVIRRGDRFEYALRVWRYLQKVGGENGQDTEDVVNEQASAGFPRDSDGRAVWRYAER